MEFQIVHLYPDAMNLYGEYANMKVLKRRLEDLGAQVTLRELTFEDDFDLTGADCIYMGAGTERTQKLVMQHLAPHAKEIEAAVDGGAVVLFTGNAMEVWGDSVTGQDGRVWNGLSLADFSTVETDRRIPHDVVAECPLFEEKVVGFMNKCSRTSGITTPLFPALLRGSGNEAEKGSEGYLSGNVFLTHLTGPILVKNPAFLDLLVKRLFAAKGLEVPAETAAVPWRAHAEEAYRVTLRELGGAE